MAQLELHKGSPLTQSPSSFLVDNLENSVESETGNGYINDENYREDVSIGKYIIIKELGTGSSAKVVLAFDKITEKRVAIKVVKRIAKSSESSITKNPGTADKEAWRNGFSNVRIFRETIISSLLDHPHIVKLLDFLYSNEYFFMVFEYVKGQQLYETVLKNSRITEDQARKYFRQIISAVDYLHKNSIVHRDLKIENIVIDHYDNVKLIDFGLSNFFDNKILLNTFCGSLYFAAPELLMGLQYSGPEVDVWSLGIILYVMLCGKVPFDDESVKELQNKIKEAKVEFNNHISQDAQDLVLNMIVPDIEKRFTMNQIKSSEWINTGYSCKVENYFGKRFPLMKLNREYMAAISEVLHFQFPNAAEQLESFYNCCNRQNDTLDSIYWIKNPVVSMYYLLAENINSYCKGNPNSLVFKRDAQGFPELLHNFVEFVFANDKENIPSKYFFKNIFQESSNESVTLPSRSMLTSAPSVKKSYFKGIFQGIKVKHIGSHNALKKIILDIFKRNNVSYEADEKGYFCSFYTKDGECYFIDHLYYNVIFSEYYLVLKCLNSKKDLFKVIYNAIQDFEISKLNKDYFQH